MSLVHWHPIKELETLRHQMHQLFDEWMHREPGWNLMPSDRDIAWIPAIELTETDTALVLKAEVPGVKVEDLDVQVADTAVSIAGKHESKTHTEEKGIVQSELRYGQFQRWIPLPTPIQHEQVKADFQHGILTLTLPKAELTQHPILKLNLEEQLRDTVTQQRQTETHRQQTLHRRAEDALETIPAADLDRATREAVTQERQHEEHQQETAHMRAVTSER